MISLSVRQEDINRVQRELATLGAASLKVCSRALNKTLTGVKTDASAQIRKELNVKKATVDKTFRIQRATTSRLAAAIESMGRPLPLSQFTGTRQTKNGVSVKVKKTGPRKIIKHSFLATMKSGHLGVFWREGKKRLPISQRFSSRVPDVFENESVMGVVQEKATERLHKNILHELNYELSKRR